MKYEIERLKTHLSKQIKTAEKLNSDWVYITLNEAKLCLKLAESEEDILNDVVDAKTLFSDYIKQLTSMPLDKLLIELDKAKHDSEDSYLLEGDINNG